MKTAACFLFIVIFALQNISAQNKIVDSLKKVLLTEKEDTNEVNTLNILCQQSAQNGDYKSEMKYALDMLSVSEKINFKKGKGNAYFEIAESHWAFTDYPEALKNFYIALKIFEELGDTQSIVKIFSLIAAIDFTEANDSGALKNYYAALKLEERSSDNFTVADLYQGIAEVYRTDNNFPEALKNVNAALNIWKKEGGQISIANGHVQLSNIYFDENNFLEALKEDSIALTILRPLGNNEVFAGTFGNRARIYEQAGTVAQTTGDYASANSEFSKALSDYLTWLRLSKELHEGDGNYYWAYLSLGKLCVKMKKFTDSKNYFEKCITISKESGSKIFFERTYGGLSKLDSAQGNYKKAYEDYKIYILYRDSIYDDEIAKKSIQSQIQYEFDKKEDSTKAVENKKELLAKAEIQNQKTIRNFSYTGAAAVLSFAGVGFYRYRRRRKLQSQQEMLNERLRISRELHDDIGSTLGSISIYSEVAKNRSEKNENAEEAIAKIGNASRELIDKMSDIVWSLNPNNESFEQLLNRIQVFAAIMLTPHEILYTIYTDEGVKNLKLTAEERKNIFLIYKEAIHNIIKYAACSQVEIKMILNAGEFTMTIKDNGKGFNVSSIEESLGGNGIKNMQARAESIKASFSIYSAVADGTSVKASFKL